MGSTHRIRVRGQVMHVPGGVRLSEMKRSLTGGIYPTPKTGAARQKSRKLVREAQQQWAAEANAPRNPGRISVNPDSPNRQNPNRRQLHVWFDQAPLIFLFSRRWRLKAGAASATLTTQHRETTTIQPYHVKSITAPNAAATLEALFAFGAERIQQVANSPGLVITQPFARLPAGCNLPCWTMTAKSIPENLFLGQALIRHSRGVLLLTYRGPLKAASQRFRGVLSSLRPLRDRNTGLPHL